MGLDQREMDTSKAVESVLLSFVVFLLLLMVLPVLVLNCSRCLVGRSFGVSITGQRV